METNVKEDERLKLENICKNLSDPLKRQLLTIARVMETTQEITLAERKRKPRKINNKK